MNADLFVARLLSCAPDVKVLIERGLPREAAENFSARYRSERRTGKLEHANALVDLGMRYDADRLEIGMVRFSKPSELGEWWQIGEAEADPLVVNKETGEVEVRELANEEFVIWRCAASAEQFLDAIAEVACFISEVALTAEATTQDDVVLYDMAQRCATLAGGEQYSSFYEMVLGCDVA